MNRCRLGIIGCGNMGEAILKGILDSGFLRTDRVIFYEKDVSRRKYIEEKYKVRPAGDIAGLVGETEYILIAVKPQDLKAVLEKIKPAFNNKINSIISIAAGIPTYYIERKLNSEASVIRIMPSAPALFGRGMAAVSGGRSARESDLTFSKKLIESVGDYVLIEEKYQNAATAISGSGPAYFYLFCKYLIEAGIKNGLSPEISKKLVTGTIKGAGLVIEKSGIDMDGLIKKVASPGGTTEAALKEYIGGELDKIINKAVESAIKKAYELQEFLD